MVRFPFLGKDGAVLRLLTLSIIFGCTAAGKPAEPRRHDSAPVKAVLQKLLRENIIPFWYPATIDTENGGYRLNHDSQGTWLGPADKYLVTQARTVWFFARLAQTGYGSEQHLKAARHGYEFLRDALWDKQAGGFFWAVDTTGRTPVKADKHLYGQAFGLYAVSEYARASGDPEAAAFARKIFVLLEDRAHDPEYGGYREAFRRDWTAPELGAITSMGVPPDLKLMNTHLHLMEALTTYYRVGGDAAAKDRLVELIAIQSNAVVRKPLGACTDRYRRDWTPMRGPACDRVSYGHDIENVWLLIEACNAVGLPNAPLLDCYRTLFNYSLRYGYDGQYGGFYDAGPFNGPADQRGKTWWVQAEGLVSALWMYNLTGDAVYYDCFDRTLDWIVARQADWEHGDWYPQITEDGAAKGAKAGPWKSPYHSARAIIRCLELFESRREKG